MASASRCRIALLLLALPSLVAFAACADDDDDDDGRETNTPSQPSPSPTVDELLVQFLLGARSRFPSDLAEGYAVGDPDAPLTVTLYEDFQCPFCLLYTGRNEPGIIADYVVSGDVRLEFQHFPILGVESIAAAMAAECAQQQDRFWELHHELFLRQAEEGQVTDEKINVGRFADDALRGLASDAGLDLATYDVCVADRATLETVESMAVEARALGITGTPGVVFNGVPQEGAPSNFDGWRALLDAELARLTTGD
jgi:protein-disulfide isomerase